MPLVQFMKCCRPAWLWLLTPTLWAAPPTAVVDNFSTSEDRVLVISDITQSLLANDTDAQGRSLEVTAVVPPAQGTLVVNPDGTFSYTPAPGFSGSVTFSYRARTVVPPVTFTIDPAQSRVRMTARLTTQGGNANDFGDSRVAGTMSAHLDPDVGPFSLARVMSVDGTLIDKVDMDFGIGCLPFFGCAVNLQVDTRATDPGRVQISLVAPGPEATVTSGLFTQSENLFSLKGIIDITSDSSLVASGPQTLDTTTTQALTNAQITSNGQTLTLKVPITYSGRSFLDATNQNTNYADITISTTGATGSSGFIVGTAPASGNLSESSPVTTVTLTILPVDDPPVAVGDGYVVEQGQSLAIPAGANPVTSVVLPPRSGGWRYRYDGLAPDAAWNKWTPGPANLWTEGAGILGHGDVDIVTAIRPLPLDDSSTNHATAYFRRAIEIGDLRTVSALTLGLMRDDAAVVFVNGTEVYRDAGLPVGATHLTYATTAVPNADETVYVSIPVPVGILLPGPNLVAVEVHQSGPDSSDLRFDLQATIIRGQASVLANDRDEDSPRTALAAQLVSQPSGGSVSLNLDGTFTYTPRPGFSGQDRFVYEVKDRAVAERTPILAVPRGSEWRYLADGTVPLNWQSAAFNDQAWPAGDAQLGYGDGDEATDLRPAPTTTPIYPSYLFRKVFTFAGDLVSVGEIRGSLLRDDAAAIYLNGQLIYRDPHLPASATPSDYGGTGTPSETEYAAFTVPATTVAGALVTGANVIAVVVHQASATSSDVSFDLELELLLRATGVVSVMVVPADADGDQVGDDFERRYALDPTVRDGGLDPDGDGMSHRIEFLFDLDPLRPSQRPQAVLASVVGAEHRISFGAVSPRRRYQLFQSTNLRQWRAVGSPVLPTGETHHATIAAPASGDVFYRLESLSPLP